MNKNFLLLASAGVTITVLACACASAPRPAPVSPACAAVSDSLSKYVSVDALPFAHLIGTPTVLPVPPSLRRGDSIAVEFVVRRTGSRIQLGRDHRPTATRVREAGPRFVTESAFHRRARSRLQRHEQIQPGYKTTA